MLLFRLTTKTYLSPNVLVYMFLMCTADRCTRSWPYLFILILSFQLTLIIHLSSHLLVYIYLQIYPFINLPAPFLFSPDFTCTFICQLVCCSTYWHTHPKMNAPVNLDDLLLANKEDLSADSTNSLDVHRYIQSKTLPVHFYTSIPKGNSIKMNR